MPKQLHGKKYREIAKLVDPKKLYTPQEALTLVKKASYVAFDPSVELHVVTGLKPEKAEQQVRGVVTLPHGTGKTLVVLVFAKGDAEEKAKKAGADFVGNVDLIQKIQKGWLEFDVAISTPDMMGEVGKLGKFLGTKGLMPNPKKGTITKDVDKAVENFKKGTVEYRLEKQPIMHTYFGKLSFSEDHLSDNLRALTEAIVKAKPSAAKGQYIKSVTINATMGPGIKLDVNKLLDWVKEKK